MDTAPVMDTLVAETFGAFAHRIYVRRCIPTGLLQIALHEASRARPTEYKASAWLSAADLRRIASAMLREAEKLCPVHAGQIFTEEDALP